MTFELFIMTLFGLLASGVVLCGALALFLECVSALNCRKRLKIAERNFARRDPSAEFWK